jgi:hypothetical protein
MNKIEASQNTPVVIKVWEHTGDLMALTEDNEILILARFAGDSEWSNDTPSSTRKRAPRKKKEEEVVKLPPEE